MISCRLYLGSPSTFLSVTNNTHGSPCYGFVTTAHTQRELGFQPCYVVTLGPTYPGTPCALAALPLSLLLVSPTTTFVPLVDGPLTLIKLTSGSTPLYWSLSYVLLSYLLLLYSFYLSSLPYFIWRFKSTSWYFSIFSFFSYFISVHRYKKKKKNPSTLPPHFLFVPFSLFVRHFII